MSDETKVPKFTPKIVKNLPEKKKRGRVASDYSEVIEFVESAGGQWVEVAQKKTIGAAHGAAKRWREEAGTEFEAVVRGSSVYMRLIVEEEETEKNDQSSNDENGNKGPNF